MAASGVGFPAGAAQSSLGAAGYGLLTSVGALGAIAGTVTYDSLERRFRLGDIMRVGLIIETLTHLGLALTRTMGRDGDHVPVDIAHREASPAAGAGAAAGRDAGEVSPA